MSDSNLGSAKGFSNWYNPVSPANPTAAVGSAPPSVWERSVLDGRRMMLKRTPESEYPAGYLGTLNSRRGDKVLDSLKARINQRSYQRGVHLGERIDPGDYLWPDELSPFRGIEAVAEGRKQKPALEYFLPTPTVDGKMAPRGSQSVLTIDVHRAANLSLLRPKYGLPTKRNPVQG
jgi:hypothetical protein